MTIENTFKSLPRKDSADETFAELEDLLDPQSMYFGDHIDALAKMLGIRVAHAELDDKFCDENPKLAHIHGLALFVYTNLDLVDSKEVTAILLERHGYCEEAAEIRKRIHV